TLSLARIVDEQLYGTEMATRHSERFLNCRRVANICFDGHRCPIPVELLDELREAVGVTSQQGDTQAISYQRSCDGSADSAARAGNQRMHARQCGGCAHAAFPVWRLRWALRSS